MRCSTDHLHTMTLNDIAIETVISWLLFKHSGSKLVRNEQLTLRERAAKLLLFDNDIQKERIAAIVSAAANVSLEKALAAINDALDTLFMEAL